MIPLGGILQSISRCLKGFQGNNNRTTFPSPGKLQSECHHPWFVYFHGQTRQNQTFCEINPSSSGSSAIIYEKSIPEFRGAKILYFSPDGNWLLLLQNHYPGMLLWSPPTGKSIQLPTIPDPRDGNLLSISHGLVSDSDNPRMLVLFFVSDNPEISMHFRSTSIYLFDFSTNNWEKVTSLNGGTVFLGDAYSLYSSYTIHHGTSADVVGTKNDKWSYLYYNLENDEALCSNRVEDEKVTAYFLSPRISQEQRISYWIMPALQPLLVDDDLHNIDTMQKYDSSSSICDLSREILGLIAGNLSFIDYMHFRCVNKHCASGTIRMRLNPFPPLIYRDKVNGVFNIVDSNLNQKVSIKIPEVLNGYVICCSRHGWLFLEYVRGKERLRIL